MKGKAVLDRVKKKRERQRVRGKKARARDRERDSNTRIYQVHLYTNTTHSLTPPITDHSVVDEDREDRRERAPGYTLYGCGYGYAGAIIVVTRSTQKCTG